MAAEVGYHDAGAGATSTGPSTSTSADLHGNTVDGVHVASSGGVWDALVFGFAGMRDHNGTLTFDPRLPTTWDSISFAIAWRGCRIGVEVTQDCLSLRLVDGHGPVEVTVRGELYTVSADGPVKVTLPDQGPRFDGLLGDKPHTGGIRADGTRITSGVPDPVQISERHDPYAAMTVATDPDADQP